MIYVTQFDHAHPDRPVVGMSEASPFATVEEAHALFGGDIITQSPRLIVTDGVAHSNYPFKVQPK